MKLKTILISLSLALVLFIPVMTKAAILDPGLIADLEDCQASGCSLNLFIQLGVSVANFILGIVGALTLIMFIFGGITWLISGGSSDKVQKGKDIIIGSVVGLLIVFSSFMIIRFVSVNLLGGKFSGQAPADTPLTSDKVAPSMEQKCKDLGTGQGTCVDAKQDCGEGKTIGPAEYCGKGKKCCYTKAADNECVAKGGECVNPGFGGNPPCTTLPYSTACNGNICCKKGTMATCASLGGFWRCTLTSTCNSKGCKQQTAVCGSGQSCCAGDTGYCQ